MRTKRDKTKKFCLKITWPSGKEEICPDLQTTAGLIGCGVQQVSNVACGRKYYHTARRCAVKWISFEEALELAKEEL